MQNEVVVTPNASRGGLLVWWPTRGVNLSSFWGVPDMGWAWAERGLNMSCLEWHHITLQLSTLNSAHLRGDQSLVWRDLKQNKNENPFGFLCTYNVLPYVIRRCHTEVCDSRKSTFIYQWKHNWRAVHTYDNYLYKMPIPEFGFMGVLHFNAKKIWEFRKKARVGTFLYGNQ